jgi:PhzF family phenazine biosynthesis protein
MPIPIQLVDAFAERPWSGNPAGVVITQQPLPEPLMRSIALEMNQAETAFLCPIEPARYSLRWFSPTIEVDLCGHATLASAHALWSNAEVPSDQPIVFDTRSGPLTCRRRVHPANVSAEDAGGAAGEAEIELDFPSRPPVPTECPTDLVEALGAAPTATFSNGMDLLAVLDDGARLVSLSPDVGRIARLPVRGVIVTAPMTDAIVLPRRPDFLSRFFAPQSGVEEDPVTGSAHCCLGPYWANRLGRTELLGYQSSRRGGFVGVEVRSERTILRGRAVTTLLGELLVSAPAD